MTDVPALPPGITLDTELKPPPGITLDAPPGAEPKPPAPPKFTPIGESPIERGLRSAARTVIPPIINFLDYPIRAAAADIVGAARGGVPIDDKSREAFYRERDKSLPFAEIPETPGGKRISEVLSVPGQLIGGAVKKTSEAILGPETTKALGPAAVVAGDVAPFAVAGLKGPGSVNPSRVPAAAALDARQAGYVLPPAAISAKPGLVSNVLAGWSGKIKTAQAASERNQSVTNQLAVKALGLPADTVLTDNVFRDLRQRAGRAYRAVSAAVPTIAADAAYDTAVAGLGGKNSQAAQYFPSITKNPGIKELVDELGSVKAFPTEAGIELVKELRFNGNANLKAMGDPSKHALGLAQREAADAVDGLIERHAIAAGDPDVVSAYREARQLIAKSYDVEGVTNPATGDVNARGMARLAAKGRPLTGELDTIANAAAAFPKAMQAPEGFGHSENYSALDFFGSAAAVAHGHPGVMGAILGRPAARGALLSRPFQDRLFNPHPFWSPESALIGSELAQPHDPKR